jgi:hypothetical protein
MNSKQLYLGWVRTTQPKLYYAALQRVFRGHSAGLSGLGDDLTSSIDPGIGTVDTSVSSDVSNAVNSAAAAAQSDSSTDWFGQLANAITSIAPTVVQTEAQQNLLAINTQRAKLGLPLYSSNGTVVTGSQLAPTSQSIAQMEAALAGGSGLWIFGGLALLGVLLLTKKRG